MKDGNVQSWHLGALQLIRLSHKTARNILQVWMIYFQKTIKIPPPLLMFTTKLVQQNSPWDDSTVRKTNFTTKKKKEWLLISHRVQINVSTVKHSTTKENWLTRQVHNRSIPRCCRKRLKFSRPSLLLNLWPTSLRLHDLFLRTKTDSYCEEKQLDFRFQ